MLNCRDVSRLVASDELSSAGAILRLRARFHLLICRECRRYANQLRIIGAAARDMMRSLVPDADVLTRLERSILDDAYGGADNKA